MGEQTSTKVVVVVVVVALSIYLSVHLHHQHNGYLSERARLEKSFFDELVLNEIPVQKNKASNIQKKSLIKLNEKKIKEGYKICFTDLDQGDEMIIF